MNDLKAAIPNKVEEPQFKTLLNSLKSEASKSLEISSLVYVLSNKLQEMPASPEPERVDVMEKMEKEPVSVIDFLWVEIWKIRRANTELQRTVEHLSKVIGL